MPAQPLPSLRGPPGRAAVTRGPLAGMTTPLRPTGAHPPEHASGRGPKGNPARRAPLIRDQTVEGALAPGCSLDPYSSPPPPDTGQVGSSTIGELWDHPFVALPAKEP